MIQITKEEKARLLKLFPPYKSSYRFPRTVRQKSKRHRYYCPESEHLMRAIAGTNENAAAIVREIDRTREVRGRRRY